MENVIEKFYKSFKEVDAEGMAACYHEDVVFEDPAFGVLKGEHAANMWRMLCESQKDKEFIVNYSGISCSEVDGKAHWEAHYEFGKTGRKVHNKIDAQFVIENGKIIKHTDTFDLRTWAKQALGFPASIIGGTSFFKRKLNAQTNQLLQKFESKK